MPDVAHHTAPTDANSWICKVGANSEKELEGKQEMVDGEFKSTVVLATACVQLQTGTYVTEKCRALLDSGAQLNLISCDCAKHLRLPAIRCNKRIDGIAGNEILTQKVRVFLRSTHDDEFSMFIELYVMPSNLCGYCPSTELPTVVPVGIPMADPGFQIPAEVQLLLGAEVWAVIQGDIIYRHLDGTLLQETTLGFICFGRVILSGRKPTNKLLSYTLQTNDEVDILANRIQKFWIIEEAGENEEALSEEEEMVEQFFLQTHYRNKDGRYVVQIPMRKDAFPIADSRNIALRRFEQLENRFDREPNLRERYTEFMREYERLGHMQVATRAPIAGRTVYIPHHAITKKFRTVFDASFLNVKKISYNKLQMIGPKLQLDLQDQLLRFRKFKIAFLGDVEKMFRQVLIDSSQWDLQRIFWREKRSEPIREYWLKTVTYGMASSGYMSVRAMIQCARDNAGRFPLAAEAIEKCFYVDDGLMGAESVAQAIELAKQVSMSLIGGGFRIRNWVSNNAQLLSAIAEHTKTETVELHEDESAKVLGLRWLTNTDEMAISVNTNGVLEAETKRDILSIIAAIYDPNGFLAPIVIVAKIIMQDLWRIDKLGWKDKLPEKTIKRWKNFCLGLQLLKEFRIPRWLNITGQTIVQLHGFADASISAYGGVIFVRTIEVSGRINCIFLCAKSRVAPIKTLTIPRLELAAAELLSRVMARTIKACEWEDCRYFLWSDSSIVLHWLKKQPCELKTYVGNRVKKIQKCMKSHAWRHVSSQDNPADLVSRGMAASDFINNRLWLNGPAWLSQPESKWPEPKVKITPEIREEYLKECKPASAQINVIVSPMMYRGKNDTSLLQAVSSWSKLVRITAYVLRYVNNLRGKSARRKKDKAMQGKIRTGRHIWTDELKNAAIYWIKIAQSQHYKAEIECLRAKDDQLPPKSKIAALRPFLDANGTLRAVGRVKQARCAYDRKHPILIPPKSRVCELILQQAHIDTLHGGKQAMANYVRNNYWIRCMRTAARKITSRCVPCIRQAGKTSQQIMSDLPMDRVVPARPFVKCGVDFAGPYNIRLSDRLKLGTRNRALLPEEKGYVAVFVCLTTRAVHLEPVMSLTAEAFLAAFKRFAARRGTPETMWSDNGTNFKRTDKDLQAAVKSWQSQEVQDHVHWNGTRWNFITPSAPHQGGLWEAAVKQMKAHLKRVIGQEKYTFEAMATLLAEIEAVMNSRPICAMSDDIDDMSALTPAHFIILEPLKLPLPNKHDAPPKMAVGLFEELQARVDTFWKRWSKDYLSSLMERPKWRQLQENLRAGQLVLIKNENLAPTFWAMGRILEIKNSSDDCVRSASIKTHNAVLERPVQKLIVLPVDDELESYN